MKFLDTILSTLSTKITFLFTFILQGEPGVYGQIGAPGQKVQLLDLQMYGIMRSSKFSSVYCHFDDNT